MQWPWMISTASLGLLSACLAVSLVNTSHDRDHLSDLINNPKTGYAARLTVCHANESALERTLANQNAQIARLHDESSKRMQQVTHDITVANTAASAAERRLRVIMTPPAGNTVCERVQDVDRKFLEYLQ